ncbi:MAG: nuclear transport factor 2 family protein [Acidobacteria bacterium]|nr:nuclear transport factor 2 family protein [Acidobacteriota bacterium]
MRRITAAFALLALASASAAAQGRRASNSSLNMRRAVEQEIISQNAAWARAARAADTRALERLLADDFTLTTADGETLGKKEYIAEISSGVRKLTSLAPEGHQARVHGGGAVLTHGGTAAGEHKGRDLSGRYRWTHFYARRGRRWRCVATQVTRVRADAPRQRPPSQ